MRISRRRSDSEQRHQVLLRQQAQLEAQVNRQTAVAHLALSLEDFCRRTREGLTQASFEQKRQLVELLVDRVVVTEGEVEIRYVMPTTLESERVRFCQLHSDHRDVPQSSQIRLPGRAKLRTADRLANLLSILCILSWRIFWITMSNRVAPEASPLLALTPLEVDLLDRLVKDKPSKIRQRKRLSTYLTKIARLGGYLARASDAPPGNLVMWRGLSRLTDIELGFLIGAQFVGN
jgi:hypothetical protein